MTHEVAAVTAPRRIWSVCKEHDSRRADHNGCESWWLHVHGRWTGPKEAYSKPPCVFVEMQLASLDAVVVEKENGEWPVVFGDIVEEAILGWEGESLDGSYGDLTHRILDALAAAKEGK